MSRLNAEDIEQNIDAIVARSGKALINAVLLGNSPNDSQGSPTELHNANSMNITHAVEFDQGSADSMCAWLNGIRTELHHNSNSFDVIHYFATSRIAANDSGGVL